MAARVRDPIRTRRKILQAAYREFYRHGFQGGSLNRIVQAAGITKGALFHHFPGKRELGYAVFDEFLSPAVTAWWITPLDQTTDPLPVLRKILQRFRKRIEMETPESGFVYNGCPVCNYATEMSPLDEGFRLRLKTLYDAWRGAIADALRRGQEAGRILPEPDPADSAAFLVAALAGLGSTGKTSQKLEVFQQGLRAADHFLDSLQTV